MKKFLTMLALLSAMTLFAQGTTETKAYYLNKSKNQKTVGYVLAGSGAALIISGIIAGSGEDNNQDPNELDFGPDFEVGMWLLGGGIVVGLASIPFFISSSNNARKAAIIGISYQELKLPRSGGEVTVLQPAISLKVRL